MKVRDAEVRTEAEQATYRLLDLHGDVVASVDSRQGSGERNVYVLRHSREGESATDDDGPEGRKHDDGEWAKCG